MIPGNESPLFPNRTNILARALFVANRIDLRALEKTHFLATGPLFVNAGSGTAALFRYGVVVLFGVSPIEEVAFMAAMKEFFKEPFENPESDDVEVVLEPEQREGCRESRIYVGEFSVPRLQLIGDVLAKSIVLSHYETAIARTFDRIEPLAHELYKTGQGGNEARALLRQIGEVLAIEGNMVGRVEITDKPELLWDYPDLERLYLRLADEYELRERHSAMERKLTLICRTAETMVELLQHKRSLRVEWYIVVLIVVSVLLSVYQMFAAPAV